MKAVIAEKPSVAREIAALIGALEKHDGFFSGNGYCVTWAFGHLVALAMPDDYGITGFQKEGLPIIPDPFLLTVRKLKKEKKFVPDPSALKQLKIIKEVVGRCDSIIVATDAGREGELIFRYIYEHLNFRSPFERLWISSLTEKAIRDGFQNLRPGTDFDGLYQAARSRSRADWLVGINASQALSIAIGSGIYSLGRVQTPTLALICKRFLENKNFDIKNYWQIQLEHRKDFHDFNSLSEFKYDEKKKADDVLRALQRNGPAIVASIKKKTVSEQPPLLFDLTALQREANKKLGLSAEETLNIAQNLYENKFITYPRTGSRYIPEDVWPQVAHLVRALGDSIDFKEAVSKVSWGRFNKRIVNDLKITDHHGLLITERVPSALPPKDKKVYEMIALRLLESIAGVCSKEITDVTLNILNLNFILKGSKVLEPGWRKIQGSYSESTAEILQDLPELKAGDEVKINHVQILAKKTNPPVLYTEGTLLSAMENAGKEVESEEGKKALQNIGIGTPATRASIIETLLGRDYIKRENKSLVPTEKGMKVYDLVKDKKIADVAMTAEWELALQKIEAGETSEGLFQKQMEQYTVLITSELLTLSISKEILPELTCPKCKKQHLSIRDQLVKCPDKACNWVQFRNVCGVSISVAEIERLVTNGRTSLIKGMKTKGGKRFDAYIVLNERAQTSFVFQDKTSTK
ncbi:DNA topoisomerase III [Chryseobacterium sp. IHB B 17019]|uniref:type IA DNA topoisomerase n=1 Tax=Chryseobacterium sp. IHB B 17019 TaxID=1721091 RepID=UPI000721A2B0|nr:type IA DNA topoisomerase [Chryseobacterium sp. IHB B 17019]ALR29222.1 DNA topoisomerase III [Chryseobacterium sp. IHB B 17019]